jgi:hypothetical protein
MDVDVTEGEEEGEELNYPETGGKQLLQRGHIGCLQ